MSQENVEIVRQMWEAFLAADFQTAMTAYDEDVVWDGTNLPNGRIGRGHEAIFDHVLRWNEAWNDCTVDIESIIEAGDDQVIVFMRD